MKTYNAPAADCRGIKIPRVDSWYSFRGKYAVRSSSQSLYSDDDGNGFVRTTILIACCSSVCHIHHDSQRLWYLRLFFAQSPQICIPAATTARTEYTVRSSLQSIASTIAEILLLKFVTLAIAHTEMQHLRHLSPRTNLSVNFVESRPKIIRETKKFFALLYAHSRRRLKSRIHLCSSNASLKHVKSRLQRLARIKAWHRRSLPLQ